MKSTFINIFIFIIILSSCTTDPQNNIQIGEYIFQFPNDFKLIREKGIDSYVGKISNGKIDFQFDYGYYSNNLDKSIQEYLNEDTWKWNALVKNDLIEHEDITSLTSKTKLLKYETKDSINYKLFYLFRKDTIEYNLIIPEEIRKTKIKIDTVDNVVFKLVKAKKYVGLYLKNLNSFNKSLNSFKALSIIVEKLNNQETETALKILRSCKIKN